MKEYLTFKEAYVLFCKGFNIRRHMFPSNEYLRHTNYKDSDNRNIFWNTIGEEVPHHILITWALENTKDWEFLEKNEDGEEE